MIRKIREKAGKYLLRKAGSRTVRNRKVINLEDASDIGIIYYLPDETVYAKVSEFVRQLQDSGKKVKALGYVESKRLTGRFLPKLSYDFLYPAGLNWFCKPVAEAARDFIDTEFDLLIDLSTEDMIPLLHITALSKAKFKAGMLSNERKPYLDLMISLQGKGGLDELITQIRHYTSILNRNYDSTDD